MQLQVVLTGPRQCGKRTLFRELFPQAAILDLDDPLTLTDTEKDPVLALQTCSEPVIIDEAQRVPTLFQAVKRLVDRDPKVKTRFLITGSQIFQLMENGVESLAGRAGILQMSPLAWPEICGVFDPYDTSVVTKKMVTGFFPDLVQHELQAALRWQSSYLSSYIERDVRSLQGITDLGAFTTFLRLLALRSGQLLNLSEISNEAQISATTAKNWLNILQATGIGFLLRPYARNIGKRLTKTPKWIFADTGLLCYLLHITCPEDLLASPFCGHIFESMVIRDIAKRLQWQTPRPEMTFYRSAYGEEVDLILEFGAATSAIEIKFASGPSSKHAEGRLKLPPEMQCEKRQLLSLQRAPRLVSPGVEGRHWFDVQLSLLATAEFWLRSRGYIPLLSLRRETALSKAA